MVQLHLCQLCSLLSSWASSLSRCDDLFCSVLACSIHKTLRNFWEDTDESTSVPAIIFLNAVLSLVMESFRTKNCSSPSGPVRSDSLEPDSTKSMNRGTLDKKMKNQCGSIPPTIISNFKTFLPLATTQFLLDTYSSCIQTLNQNQTHLDEMFLARNVFKKTNYQTSTFNRISVILPNAKLRVCIYIIILYI